MGGDSEGMAGPDGAVGRAWVIAPPAPRRAPGPPAGWKFPQL